MKHIIGFVAMLLPIICGAQSPPVRALSVGDTVPDVTIRNVYNYPDSVIKLSDLKGKLTILDFWATWCGGCIYSFPKMMHLKKTFGEDLQILCVNSFSGDDYSKVSKSFANWRKRLDMNITLPYALKDTLLSQMFPHLTIPHYVWIGSSNRILAITHSNDVTEENILSVLDGKEISLYVKRDELLYNIEVPLLVNGNGGDADAFLYRSILTKYKTGLGHTGGREVDGNGNITKVYFINTTPLSLIRQAYPMMRNYNRSRLIYKVPDHSKFKDDSEPEIENSFCYELICPPVSEGKMQEYMQADISKFFNITAKIAKENIDCYLLKPGDNFYKILSKGDSSYSQIARSHLHKKLIGQPVSKLAELLEYILKKPVLVETNDSHKIDLALPQNIYNYDLDSIIAFLRMNCFDLIPTVRNINVAVITENSKQ